MQTPIAPPYQEAISLLQNRDTDFRRSDVNVVVENINSMTISDFKKQAKQKRKEANESKVAETQDYKGSDDNEDVLELGKLMSDALSDKSEYKDNDNV